MDRNRNLVYAIGNPSRQDDGLGYHFISLIEGIKGWDILHQFQLNIEDAELFSKYRKIIIVDASKRIHQPYFISELKGKVSQSFTTHALTPEAVLHLCHSLYNEHPKTFLLEIKGTAFELEEGLTVSGQKSVQFAVDWFLKTYALDHCMTASPSFQPT